MNKSKKTTPLLIDFAPTLLDAAGIDVPEDLSGRSFLPLVTNKVTN
ncbi:sulfatase/phosphatase domain-containing protein [Gracilibacillus saliphilus]|nr:sulfatase/phosphatase domain-containing protein [Gracilibacillus saliphilus]